tara:strand:+ start:153 stop:536 length:384 start_codon:yes stop_codon:yes gene_type:complete
MKLILRYITGANPEDFPIDLTKNRSQVIGSRGDVKIDYKMISRRHCQISYTPENGLFLEDLGSRYGTEIKGEPLEERKPKLIYDTSNGSIKFDGIEIKLAQFPFTLLEDKPSQKLGLLGRLLSMRKT